MASKFSVYFPFKEWDTLDEIDFLLFLEKRHENTAAGYDIKFKTLEDRFADLEQKVRLQQIMIKNLENEKELTQRNVRISYYRVHDLTEPFISSTFNLKKFSFID